MRSNLHELPDLVRLAAEIGIEEVKVVYLTVFGEDLMNESLWGCENEIRTVFDEAIAVGEELGIVLKLPHIPGEDIAESKLHKDCFVAWRDFSWVRMVLSDLVCLRRFSSSNMIKIKILWISGTHRNIKNIVQR